MRINRKGQVTIAKKIRDRLGLPPHPEVEFEMARDHVRIRRARSTTGNERKKTSKGSRSNQRYRRYNMCTEEIMTLTRG
jgi:AbrB family looped-hinge helix DNA binding protein